MLTPTSIVCVLILLVAIEVVRYQWSARKNTKVQSLYLAAFREVQRRCLTTEYFVHYLEHIKNVIATRDKNEVLQFDTAPNKLLESFLKQQLRNVDPEYKLFDERLAWLRQTIPSSQINLPATAWMNEYVGRWANRESKPAPTPVILSRLDETIEFVKKMPPEMQLLPGVSSDGRLGVHLERAAKGHKKRLSARGYFVLTALWTLHLGLVISHGKTWDQLFGDPAGLILTFGPPLVGFMFLQVAFWVKPMPKKAQQPAGTLSPYLFQSLGGVRTPR